MRKICVTFVCIELHYGIKTRVEHMAAIEQLLILFVALLLLIHFNTLQFLAFFEHLL